MGGFSMALAMLDNQMVSRITFWWSSWTGHDWSPNLGASCVDRPRLGHPMLLRLDAFQKGLQMPNFGMQQFLGIC